MRQKIDATGVWWTPEAPDRRFSGSLTFDPTEGAVLVLTSEEDPKSFSDRTRNYPIVYGRSTSGKDFTLLDCFDQGSEISFGRIERREIYANYVLSGFHLPSVDGPHIAEARVSYRLLARWMLLHSGISVDHDHTGLGLSIKYERPVPIEIDGPPGLSLGIESLLRSYPSGASWDGEIDIQENWFIRIRPEEPQPLSYFIRISRAIQDLLSFACLHLCEATTISLDATTQRPDSPIPEMGELSFVTGLHEAGRPGHPGDFLFKYADVSTELGTIFSRWFELAEKLEPVRHLYFSARYSDHLDVESTFTSTIQSVEVFHRRLRRGVYMPMADFEQQVRAPLSSSIPTSVEPSFRESLLARIQYLNEFSLSRRLKDLYAQNRAIVDRMVHGAQAYLADAVAYRNFLTHYTGDSGSSGTDPERLAMCSELLQLLLELALLRELGFSEDRINTLVNNCQAYKFRFGGWPRTPPSI